MSKRMTKSQLIELLQSVEWVQPMYNGSPSCSSCGNQKHWGHQKYCELALAIGAPTEQREEGQ